MSRRIEGAPPIGLGTVDTKVTSLEMLERPVRPALHPPANHKIALIRAEPPTVAFYRFLFDRVGTPWTWVGRRWMTDDALTTIITDPAVEIYVLHVNGTPAGYGEIDRREGPAKTELTYFGLMSEFIGLGVGWWLLNTVIDLAWSGPCERLWVHTCDLDHPRALSLYQRVGFQPFEQYDETLPDPRLLGLPLPQPRHGQPEEGDVSPSGDHTVTPIRGKRVE
ncbi:MAG: GNAT family N-acetyltransferase [Alphaproteobacteria bacterium]|nr:GNAT family N-acetyltransferase [Alphaproteobacteria bacterium]